MKFPKQYVPAVVTREEWGAEDPQDFIESRDDPAEYVIVTHAPAVNRCFSRRECCKAMQALQKFHMDKGAPDLPYNFLVGHDDNVYEGRGWWETVPVPPQNQEIDGKCLVFAFIGPMRANYEMKIEDFKTAYALVHYGLEKNYINEGQWGYGYMTDDWNAYKKVRVRM